VFRRILMYSHDSYGLGHFRRSLTIAEYLLARSPEATVLAVTGSPRAHSFRLPHRFDYVKLPSATKDAQGAYCPRELDIEMSRLVTMRAAILRDCAEAFRPDLVLIDHTPLGIGGELRPLLEWSRGRGIRKVLGMRDIIDEPQRVRAAWKRQETLSVLREHYDAVLLYGDRQLFDPVSEYGMPADLACRVFGTGYVVRNGGREQPEALRARLRLAGKKLVVVTTGGGGDGCRLLKTYLRGLSDLGPEPGFASFLVTGPFMSGRKKEQICDMASGLPAVEVVEFLEDLPSLHRAADLVVAMGGYNTVAEIMSARTPALIVPRVKPRLEQWVRARALAERGLVDCMHPDDLRSSVLMRRVQASLQRRVPRLSHYPDMNGLSQTFFALEAIQQGVGAESAARHAAADRSVRIASGGRQGR